MAQAKKKNKALLALTSSALLLPGLSPITHAVDAPSTTTVGYRYTDYGEEDLPADQVFGSVIDRYQIDVQQFSLVTPIGDQWGVAANLQNETLSGASPWFSEQNSAGELKQVMSGASIREERTDISVTTTRYHADHALGVTMSYSDEDDYESMSLGLDGEKELNNKLTTIGAGVSYADDTLEPTQGFVPTNTLKDHKHTVSTYISVSQIINPMSMLQAGLSVTQTRGYLTDPYKWKDSRPSSRDRYTLSAGYRYYLERMNAALHADYRYYWDDWDVQSHTLDFAWYQNLDERMQLVPMLRFYSQKEAEFFSNTLDDTLSYRSTDYRLSTYGAYSFGMQVIARIEHWTFTFMGEKYKSNFAYGLSSEGEGESPGLLQYTRYTFGFDYRFD